MSDFSGRHVHAHQRSHRGAQRWLAMPAGVGVLSLFLALAAAAEQEPIDRIAQLNAPALEVPAEERAWPIYREAMIEHPLRQLDLGPIFVEDRGRTELVRPNDAGWAEAREFLAAHADLLDAIRAGGAKPGLGLTVGHEGHFRDEDTLALYGPDYDADAAHDPGFWGRTLMSVLLPHVGPMRSMARLTAVDMRAALEDGDVERFIANARALAGLSRQTREVAVNISELVSRSIMRMLVEELGHLLHHNPEALSAAQWETVSEIVTSLDDLRQPSFEMEHAFVEELLAKLYGPDGQLSERGRAALRTMPEHVGEPMTERRIARIARRDEVQTAYEMYAALLEADARRPLGELIRDGSAADAFVQGLDQDRMFPLTYPAQATPAVLRTTGTSHATRQALVMAVAAERYRMGTGRYPVSAEALVPEYLPAVPRDVSVSEGHLLLTVDDDTGLTIYGRGLNSTDDGGTTVADYVWPRLTDAADGDWVLYPLER